MNDNDEFMIYNPTTGEPLPSVRSSSQEEIERAVVRSIEAFAGPWRLDHRRRAQVLNAWADLLERDSEQIVDDLVVQTGKLVGEAKIELAGSIDALRFNAGLTRLPLGRATSLYDGTEAHLIRDPIGPTVFIAPWNWPVLLLLRDLAPALAAGVTALIKPAPQTTHVTKRILDLAEQAGVPSGVAILVSGGADVGSKLVRHSGTKAVAITGSSSAGQSVLRDCAETMTRPLLELGGKSTMLVLPDANIKAAFSAAVNAAIITSRQMCMACTRILVHESAAFEAEVQLKDLFLSKRPGDPRDSGSSLGPIISEDSMEKISGYVALAGRTARIISGGERVRVDGLSGYFMNPALITEVESSSPLVQDDIFGPVLTLETYKDEDEGITLANATDFGLTSAVWTENLSRGLSVARAINAGTVWVNGYNKSYAEMPSGGINMSGMGRTRGIEGVEQFTELKHVHFTLK